MRKNRLPMDFHVRRLKRKERFNTLEKICYQFFNVDNLAGGFQVKLAA